jgi:hypothetical protein
MHRAYTFCPFDCINVREVETSEGFSVGQKVTFEDNNEWHDGVLVSIGKNATSKGESPFTVFVVSGSIELFYFKKYEKIRQRNSLSVAR